MSEELDIIKIVTQRLDSEAIPYMLTGSIAMSFYATPRMTRDIDCVIEVQEGKSEIIYNLFKGDFYIDLETIKSEILRSGMFNIIHNELVIKVDFILRKPSEYRKLEFSRRRSIEIDGATISIVAPEDLLLSKLVWAKESMSEMQLNDVKNLIEDVVDMDTSYVKGWVEKLNLTELYQRVTA